MITAQIESFRSSLHEFIDLFPLHYEELALNKDHVPLDPQYEVYFERENAGALLFVTLRESSVPIGYFIGFVSPGLHYKTCLTCITDILWVHPDKRGSVGKILMDFVEKELRRRGVKRWIANSKNHKPIKNFFNYLNFEEIETIHSKWLGE